MRVSKKFLKTIPIDRKVKIVDEIKSFENEFFKKTGFTQMSKGYSIKKIDGTDIYKFRVNQSDRILFRLDKEEIVFLEYCNHDSQIRVGKSIDKVNVIDFHKTKETQFEESIDAITKEKFMTNIYKDMYDIILEDDYIGLSVESDKVDDKKYLTLEQFKCINKIDGENVILGCAGSGKTHIGLNKLIIGNNISIRAAYIAPSKNLVESTREMFQNLSGEKDKTIDFFTIEELAGMIAKEKRDHIMDFNNFFKYMKNIKLEKNLNIEIVWREINSVIKGEGCILGRPLNLEEYLKKNSVVEKAEKREIFSIFERYQKWVDSSKFFDINDLYLRASKRILNWEKYDFIICDECEEFNENELYIIRNIVKDDNIMFIGDINQRLQLTYENITSIAKGTSINDIKVLNKNFRSSYKNVEFFNKLKKSNFNRKNILNEVAIRNGEKPLLIQESKFWNVESLNKIFNDVDSILVVENEIIKKKIKSEMFDTERIFTVEEVRGLEYKSVYIYKLYEYSRMNKNINYIYVAASRAREKIIFIENEIREFEKEFYGLYDNINEIKIEESLEDIEKWEKEGKKLKKVCKYLQAADAYEKAKLKKEADQCRRAYQLKEFIFNSELNKLMINIYGNLSEENISEMIREVENKGIKFNNFIQLITYQYKAYRKERYIYIKNKSTKEKASLIKAEIFAEIMYQDRITLVLENKINFKKDYALRIDIGKDITFSEEIIEVDQFRSLVKEYDKIKNLKEKTEIEKIEDEEFVESQGAKDFFEAINKNIKNGENQL